MKRIIVTITLIILLSSCQRENNLRFENLPELIEISEGYDYDLFSNIEAYDNEILLEDVISVDLDNTSELKEGTYEITYTIKYKGNILTEIVSLKVYEGSTPNFKIKDPCRFILDVGVELQEIHQCFTYMGETLQSSENIEYDTSFIDFNKESVYFIDVKHLDEEGVVTDTIKVHLEIVDYTNLEHFTYSLNNDNTSYAITQYKDFTNKDVIIPSHINFLPVTVIGPHSFSNMGLNSVILPEDTTTIGFNAFSGNNLTTIDIPPGVTEIPNKAFQRNKITSLYLYRGVTKIGDEAFKDNNIIQLRLPLMLSHIGREAFFDNNDIEEIIIPENVTYIGESAFFGNFATKVTLTDNIEFIGRNAFSGHLADEIYIGEKLISCNGAFHAAQEFAGSDNVGPKPFNYVVSDSNPVFTEINGVLFKKDLKEIVHYPLNPRGDTYTIPSSVVKIGPEAFFAQQFNELFIPSSVTIISRGAFSAAKLDTLKIPATVQTIERVAFLYTKVQTLYLEIEFSIYEQHPDSILNIEVHDFVVNEGNPLYHTIDGVLFNGDALMKYPVLRTDKEYIIPDGTRFLGNRSFSQSKIEKLTIPASVEGLAARVFFIGDILLTEIVVLGDDPTRLNHVWENSGFPVELKPVEGD